MKINSIIFALFAALLISGCQNSVNSIENADKTMQPDIIRDKRFVTDGFLKDRLALRNLTVSETADGFKRVQLTATNIRVGVLAQAWSGITGENPYHIRYKFTWFDQNGMAVESILSTWQSKVIIPGESVHFQSVAPNKDCKDFQIELKEAN